MVTRQWSHVRPSSVREIGRVESSESINSLPYDERESVQAELETLAHTPTHNRPRRRTRLHYDPSNNGIDTFASAAEVDGRRQSPTRKTRPHRRNNPLLQLWSPPPSSGPISDNGESSLPPPPSLSAIASAMISILSLYCRHYCRSLRQPCRRFGRCLVYVLGTILGIALVLLLWCIRGFYVDAVRMCSPPSIHAHHIQQQRPLVEYYVHGRGNGHYARSVAIIEDLNNAGVDVRMFIGRATMLKAMHEEAAAAKTPNSLLNNNTHDRGTTTAIAVTSITPSLNVFSALSHILERITGDCEVALQTNKYPLLVIADGDMPGMLRAKLGGIPSVGISHGQVFSIATPPEWLSTKQHRAWKKQKRLNDAAAWFSSWQIATNFLFIETQVSSGVVARPPLRPEVLRMAQARRTQTFFTEEPPPQVLTQQWNGDKNNSSSWSLGQRKIVLCYFRDDNGEMVTQALLRAGFDVVEFAPRGDHKDARINSKDNTFMSKWIVHRERGRDRNSTSASLWNTPPPQQLAVARRRRLLVEEQHPPRILQITDRSLFVPLTSIADGVASSAGSQLISECIYAGVPLLAMYKKDDDEQMLNVEMTRHSRRDKQKTHVYGASFENFRSAISGLDAATHLRGGGGGNQNAQVDYSEIFLAASHSAKTKQAYREFQNFVETVQESSASQSYFESLHHGNVTETVSENNANNRPKNGDPLDNPFHGMPDAAAIILEIIKQVQNTD